MLTYGYFSQISFQFHLTVNITFFQIYFIKPLICYPKVKYIYAIQKYMEPTDAEKNKDIYTVLIYSKLYTIKIYISTIIIII